MPLFAGIHKDSGRKRCSTVVHSGYLHSAANYIVVKSQHYDFDQHPSFLWLPLNRTALELWSFSGEALEYIIIGAKADCYQRIGVNIVLNETSWISCRHPDVASAFRVFGEVMSVVMGLVCEDDPCEAPAVEKARKLREHLRHARALQAPRVKPGCEGHFLRVRLERARVCRPGAHLEPWHRFHGHPSPDPVGLMCRTYSAWLTHLLSRDQLRGVARWRQGERCKLFPSCLDADGAKECILCHASALREGLTYFSAELRDKILDIANLLTPAPES
jgi:hypothetical protein